MESLQTCDRIDLNDPFINRRESGKFLHEW